MRRVGRVFKYFLLWLAILVLLAEVVLRIKGSYYSWGEQNGMSFNSPYDTRLYYDNWVLKCMMDDTLIVRPEFTYSAHLNHEGYRGVEQSFRKRLGEKVILTLGDSFTEGHGAEYDSIWPKLLQDKLREEQGLHSVRVVQGGISGADPYYAYQAYRRKFMKYQPDLILLSINWSDITDVMVRGGMERFNSDGGVEFRDEPWFGSMFAYSHVVRYIVLEVLKYDWLYFALDEIEEEQLQAVRLIIEVLNDMRTYAQSNDAELALIFHPTVYELRRERYNYKLDELISLTVDSGFHTIDLMPYFSASIDTTVETYQDFYWPIDGHHNARGYALFAEGVEEGLMELGVLDELFEADSLTTDSTAMLN